MIHDPSFVPRAARGERCSICKGDAARKVEEAIFDDDPRPVRHPFTAYVCVGCFEHNMKLGPAKRDA